MIRYAIGPCEIDGVEYNQGDVVPNEVNDTDTLLKMTRTDSQPALTPEQIRERLGKNKKTDLEGPSETKTEDSEDEDDEDEDEEEVAGTQSDVGDKTDKTEEDKTEKSYFDEAVEKGVIDRNGNWYSFGDTKLGFGKEASLKKIAELGLEDQIKSAI